MIKPERTPFLVGGRMQKIRILWSDYVNFMAYLAFLLINITLGRVLHQADKRWKTRYLERLIAFFEKLA
ncbi:MAG TPA: hypothetical protein VK168_13715 [Saprospiraceae bacterium]|nr:hypothetical protein [Saprospiraceae bacterium]